MLVYGIPSKLVVNYRLKIKDLQFIAGVLMLAFNFSLFSFIQNLRSINKEFRTQEVDKVCEIFKDGPAFFNTLRILDSTVVPNLFEFAIVFLYPSVPIYNPFNPNETKTAETNVKVREVAFILARFVRAGILRRSRKRQRSFKVMDYVA